MEPIGLVWEGGPSTSRAGIVEESPMPPMNARPSYLEIPDQPDALVFEFDDRVRKNIAEELRLVSGNEETRVKTFLRIRPNSKKTEKDGPIEPSPYVIEDQFTLVVHPSITATTNGKQEYIPPSVNRFTFTKVLGPEHSQSAVFEECVHSLLDRYFVGENCLVFSYGATNSGKTFTMQGYGNEFGIVPRTLDYMFNRLEETLYKRGDIKPNEMDALFFLDNFTTKNCEETKQRILREANLKSSDLASFHNSISSVCSGSVTSKITSAPANFGQDSLPPNSTLYCIWISFAEVYNEKVYDLFERVGKGKKKRELKLFQDRSGRVYIKDLTECCANNADEAYQLFLAGKQNLQFAATSVNQNSSRSHSFFNIRMVSVGTTGTDVYPQKVYRLTFCDLAGLERVAQTQNTGTRLKESGNINQSLVVLLRCIRAMRENQRGKREGVLVPTRDSKLARLFQSFLNTAAQVSMIVNITRDPEMYLTTLQVLQNSAIASEIRTFSCLEAPANESNFCRKVRESICYTERSRLANLQRKHEKEQADSSSSYDSSSEDSDTDGDNDKEKPLTAVRMNRAALSRVKMGGAAAAAAKFGQNHMAPKIPRVAMKHNQGIIKKSKPKAPVRTVPEPSIRERILEADNKRLRHLCSRIEEETRDKLVRQFEAISNNQEAEFRQQLEDVRRSTKALQDSRFQLWLQYLRKNPTLLTNPDIHGFEFMGDEENLTSDESQGQGGSEGHLVSDDKNADAHRSDEPRSGSSTPESELALSDYDDDDDEPSPPRVITNDNGTSDDESDDEEAEKHSLHMSRVAKGTIGNVSYKLGTPGDTVEITSVAHPGFDCNEKTASPIKPLELSSSSTPCPEENSMITARTSSFHTPEKLDRQDLMTTPEQCSLRSLYMTALCEQQDFKQKNEELLETVRALQDCIEEKDDEIFQLNASVQKLQDEISREKEECNELQLRLDAVEKSKESTIGEIQAELSTVKLKNNLKQQELEATHAKIIELQKDLEDGEKLCIEYHQKLDEANTRIGILDKLHNKLHQENLGLRSDAEFLNFTIEDQTNEISKLKAEVANKNAALKEAQSSPGLRFSTRSSAVTLPTRASTLQYETKTTGNRKRTTQQGEGTEPTAAPWLDDNTLDGDGSSYIRGSTADLRAPKSKKAHKVPSSTSEGSEPFSPMIGTEKLPNMGPLKTRKK